MFNLPSLSRRGGARALGAACAGGLMLALLPATGRAQADPAPCPEGVPAIGLYVDREAGIHSQTQLPQACLKSLVRQCDVDAETRFLDGASAATCSMRYEALLRHGFRGDFHAFLRWWQSAPDVASQ